MKHKVITATAVLLFSTLSAFARPPVAVLEDGREVASAMLTLPSMPDGTVAIQGCGACKRLTFTLSRTAQFFIGKQEVSFTDLKRHLHDHPKASVLVVSPINQPVVTRISASTSEVK